jgi:CPA2 family monovalent cation:H+ antiporter-2
MLLGSSAFATQIRADISSLRVVLLTLFFGAAGMVADPIWILKNWASVGGVVLALTMGKLAIVWAVFQTLGQATRVAAATGLCLAQVGEFAFVLGSMGRANGVVSEELYALVVSVTIVSFFLSAVLVPRAPQFGTVAASLFRRSPAGKGDAPAADLPPDVVVIGFGPAGAIASRPFVDRKLRILVIDLNHEGVRRAEELGFDAQIGDATQSDVLEHARLSQCKAVAITLPDYRAAQTILEQVRRHAPQAYVVVRSRHERHTSDFTSAGAHAVAGDEETVGERLAGDLRRWLQSQDAAGWSDPADHRDAE